MSRGPGAPCPLQPQVSPPGPSSQHADPLRDLSSGWPSAPPTTRGPKSYPLFSETQSKSIISQAPGQYSGEGLLDTVGETEARTADVMYPVGITLKASGIISFAPEQS